jgi:hypothetical protein
MILYRCGEGLGGVAMLPGGGFKRVVGGGQVLTAVPGTGVGMVLVDGG